MNEALRRIRELEAINAQITRHRDGLAVELAAARATNDMYESMAKALEVELFGDDFGRSRDELVERAAQLAARDPKEAA